MSKDEEFRFSFLINFLEDQKWESLITNHSVAEVVAKDIGAEINGNEVRGKLCKLSGPDHATLYYFQVDGGKLKYAVDDLDDPQSITVTHGEHGAVYQGMPMEYEDRTL